MRIKQSTCRSHPISLVARSSSVHLIWLITVVDSQLRRQPKEENKTLALSRTLFYTTTNQDLVAYLLNLCAPLSQRHVGSPRPRPAPDERVLMRRVDES